VGTGVELSNCDLAESVANPTGYSGAIYWDTSKPGGSPKKHLDMSSLANVGGTAQISLVKGLINTL
jgi:GDP-L-fucose synthase